MKYHVPCILLFFLFLILLSGCLGSGDGGGLTGDDAIETENPSTKQNMTNKTTNPDQRNSNADEELSLGNRTLKLNKVGEKDIPRKNTVINASNLPEYYVIDSSVNGDMRIEPTSEEDRVGKMYQSVRKRLYQYLKNGSSSQYEDVYIQFDNEYYKVTVGNVWEGGPTIDPSDRRDVITVSAEQGLGNVTPNVVITRAETVVHDGKYVTNETTSVYEIDKPGNYTVEITWDDRRIVETFDVEFKTLADCNSKSFGIILTPNGHRTENSSTLLNCNDPADTGI